MFSSNTPTVKIYVEIRGKFNREYDYCESSPPLKYTKTILMR